ncbi:MAG TPA: hypothetical protein VNJ08_17265 [Bacteriovoracaceae bacterium]|nr:hypothetical protein [Bacteriovoracaceae bacterium]
MLRSVHLFILFTLFSCATGSKLADAPIDSVLDSLKVTGEGRGRLSLEQGQYLFSYEALLKDEVDWLLAVTVPLHGEEVMILPKIKDAVAPEHKAESFEARLESEISSRIKGSDLSGKDYIRELRSMIRFILAKQLTLNRECEKKSEQGFLCNLEQEVFEVKVEKDKIFIHKLISESYTLELVGENLTDSIFTRTNFNLHSQKRSKKAAPVLALELFWK